MDGHVDKSVLISISWLAEEGGEAEEEEEGKGEEEEKEIEIEIHYVHVANKDLCHQRGRVCHAVWASVISASTRAQSDFWTLCHVCT